MPDSVALRRRVPWLRLLAEFAAIFAGVSLSLLADDWRQYRADRAQEVELLLGLQSDLVADSADLVPVRRRGERWNQGAVRLRLRMESSEELPPDSVYSYVEPVVWRNTYQPVTSTYASLKAGGLMTLIRDVELRRLVSKYYEVDQPAAVANYDVAIAANDNLRSYALWEVPLSDSLSRYFPITELRLTRDWAGITGNAGFKGSIFTLGTVGGDMANTFGRLLDKNAELRGAIDEALSAL